MFWEQMENYFASIKLLPGFHVCLRFLARWKLCHHEEQLNGRNQASFMSALSSGKSKDLTEKPDGNTRKLRKPRRRSRPLNPKYLAHWQQSVLEPTPTPLKRFAKTHYVSFRYLPLLFGTFFNYWGAKKKKKSMVYEHPVISPTEQRVATFW